MREAVQTIFPSQSMRFLLSPLIHLCQYNNLSFQRNRIFSEEQNLIALFIM